MKTLILSLCFLYCINALAQDTFSIVAVDTTTSEIGSAGASCVGPINGVGAFILSDVIEGVGAIHTQASWLSANQQAAHNQMLLGRSPQQIIDFVVANDAQGNPTIRQYGIVDLTRRGETAAYTGVNCTSYKNHVTGPGYAVQGNILSGQVIIDTMKNVFLRTHGPLADRLMASLEAAKIIGADTRCAVRGTSSRSAFLKVVRLGDGSVPYLQSIVPDSPVNVDPITILRLQFNHWKDSLRAVADPFLSDVVSDRDTLEANGTSQAVITILPKNNSDSLLAPGLTVILDHTGGGVLSPVSDLGNGTYVATLTAPGIPGVDTVCARVVQGTDTVTISARPAIVYSALSALISAGEYSPRDIILSQNFPNPFNPTTRIRYSLPVSVHASLIAYDISGRRVRVLDEGWKSAGIHEVRVDGRGLTSGSYYYQLSVGHHIVTRRFLLLK